MRDVQCSGHVHRNAGSVVSVRERVVEEERAWKRRCVCVREGQMNASVSGVVVDAGEGGTSIVPVVCVG